MPKGTVIILIIMFGVMAYNALPRFIADNWYIFLFGGLNVLWQFFKPKNCKW